MANGQTSLMLGLRRFVSSIKLSKDREDDGDGEIKNSQLGGQVGQKKTGFGFRTRDRSRRDLNDQRPEPSRRIPRHFSRGLSLRGGSLRQDIFEPEPPINDLDHFDFDFDKVLQNSTVTREHLDGQAESFPLNVVRHDLLGSSLEDLLRATNGKATEPFLQTEPPLSVASMCQRRSRDFSVAEGGSIGRYGLPVHPDNRSSAASIDSNLTFQSALENFDDLARSTSHQAIKPETDPFHDSNRSRQKWAERCVPNPLEKIETKPSLPSPRLDVSPNGTTPRGSKGPLAFALPLIGTSEIEEGLLLPFMREFDWIVSEERAMETAKSLDGAGISPPDSAVAFPEVDAPAYVGKGKGRARDSEGHARELRDAIDSMLAAELQRKEDMEYKLREEHDRAHALELQEQIWKEREAEALLEAGRPRLRDCHVCSDSKSPLDFPAKAATSKCQHPPQICRECVEAWMTAEFDTKGCDGLRCPECPEELSYDDVQTAASADTFAAFDKLSTRAALANLAEFAWCLAPGCPSGQLNINNNHFMDCVGCGYKQCLRHQVPWHTGETCEQYGYRTSGQKARDEERQSEAVLQSCSKRCPGVGCGWRIQKIDGCDHMTCRKCRHEFCWLCLASQVEIRRVGNTAHAADCPYHSDNINVSWPFNVH